MKILFTALLISAFLGIAVFGFFLIIDNCNYVHGHGGCITNIIGVANCAKGGCILSFLNSHSYTLNNFSDFYIPNLETFLLFSVILLVAAGLRKLCRKTVLLNIFFWFKRFLEFLNFSFKQRFNDWLSLYENSPNLF